MSWKRKVRVGSFALGVVLMVGMLVGARLLSPGSGGGSDPAPKAAPEPARNGAGPIVIGFVYSNPPMVGYGLPPVLPSGQIVKVHVTEDSHVKEGDPLYEFDSTQLRAKLDSAKEQVKFAESEVAVAKQAVIRYQNEVDAQELKVKAARLEEQTAKDTLAVVEHNVRETWQKQGADEPRIEAEIKNFPEAQKWRATAQQAKLTIEVQEKVLEGMKKLDVSVQVAKAQAAVGQAEAARREAEAAVNQCVVKALTAGRVERVTVGAGATVGPTTRTPVVELIPDGQLIVRAEVEPEFVDRLRTDLEGRTVDIYDYNNPKFVYKGVVRKPGNSFLPRRTFGDALVPTDTRVLEVPVEVTDPAPAKTPPLKVGQKVKVNLGQ